MYRSVTPFGVVKLKVFNVWKAGAPGNNSVGGKKAGSGADGGQLFTGPVPAAESAAAVPSHGQPLLTKVQPSER